MPVEADLDLGGLNTCSITQLYGLFLKGFQDFPDVSSLKKFKFKIHMSDQRLRILHRTTSSLKSVVFFWWVENLATHIHDWWCGKVKMNANVFQVKKTYVPYFFIFFKYFSHSHIFSYFSFWPHHAACGIPTRDEAFASCSGSRKS